MVLGDCFYWTSICRTYGTTSLEKKKTDKSLINAGHMPQKCLHTSKAEIPNTQTPRYQNATKCFFKQCIAAEGWRGERYYTPLPDFLQYLRS